MNYVKLGSVLEELWERQASFNKLIRKRDTPPDETIEEYWAKQYLLGLISEVDEVLREFSWKRHRQRLNLPLNRENLAGELADLTKYVLSLWQNWEFSLEEALRFSLEKTLMLEVLATSEQSIPHPEQHVLVCDLDGVIADYRSTFLFWLQKQNNSAYIDMADSLKIDLDHALEYPVYHRWKDQFERDGGYGTLVSFEDGIETLQKFLCDHVFVAIFTARPVAQYHRIWMDTWNWLAKHEIIPDKLCFGSEERVLFASEMRDQGHKVILFDDDPTLIRRALGIGLKVFARWHRYNQGIVDPNLRYVSNYYEVPEEEGLWND